MKLKNFTERVNLNFVFSKAIYHKEFSHEIFSLFYKLKKSYYQILKNLKLYKGFLKGCTEVSNFSLGCKLQTNNFYVSLVELLKSARVKRVKKKITIFQNQEKFCDSFQGRDIFVNSSASKKIKKKNFKALACGFSKFDKFYSFSLNSLNKRRILLEKLKLKNFEHRLLFSRFFLYTSEKKDKKNFVYVLKRKRKLNSLFNVFPLSSLRYKSSSVQRKLLVKRFGWKMKKSKKWQGSNSILRFRQGFPRDFFIPNHLEINYKTFCFVYLGYTDFKTVSTKIPFWLNLRKLLTYMIK